jgi:hypothetical protein
VIIVSGLAGILSPDQSVDEQETDIRKPAVQEISFRKWKQQKQPAFLRAIPGSII